MANLGQRYLTGDGVRPDPTRALEYLVPAAEAGDADAMAAIGTALISGDGVERDVPGGRIVLQEAAEAGHVGAMTELGRSLLEGPDADPERGRALLRRAAEAGSAAAQFALGRALLDGAAGGGDVREGADCLMQAAAQGHGGAFSALADAWLRANGLAADDRAEAERWVEEVLAEPRPAAVQALADLIETAGRGTGG